MNKFVLLLLVAMAIAVGYLLGTEQGRQQRDQLIETINKKRGIAPESDVVDLTASEAAEEAAPETAAPTA